MTELNDVPNYVDMFSKSFAAGRDMAKQKGVQNALSMAATDPQGAQNALVSYGAFPEANALGQITAQQRTLKAQQDVAPQIAQGDYAGATKTAAAAGQFDMAKEIGGLDAQQREAAAAHADIIARAAYGLSQKPADQRPALYEGVKQHLLTMGFKPEELAHVDLSDQGLAQIAQQAMSVKDTIASHQRETELNNQKAESDARIAQSKAQMAETARHNRADEGNAAGNLAINRQKLQMMSSGGGMQPEDLDFYAQKYARDGTLPSLMGPSGTAIKSQIMARAAQFQRGAGQTGADFATTVAGTKANSAALTDQAKKTAAITSAEATANKTGDLALQLAKAGGAGPSAAIFNKPIQQIRGQFSDPQAAAFNNALGTFRDEYAKVIGGGGAPTDALRHDVDSRINGAMSIGELEKVISTMKTEMQFRTQSQSDGQSALRDNIHGGPASSPDHHGAASSPALSPDKAAKAKAIFGF